MPLVASVGRFINFTYCYCIQMKTISSVNASFTDNELYPVYDYILV